MARIIEATAVISGRAGDLSGFDKVATKLSAISKAGQQVKTALAGAGTDLSKRVEEISSKLAKIENFRTMSRGLDDAALAMKRAQQEAAKLKTAIDAAGSDATRKMQQNYATAARAVERATEAFRAQGQAVRQARAALSEAGIPVNRIAKEQAQLAASLDKTTAAMHRQAQAGRTMTGTPAARPLPNAPIVPMQQRSTVPVAEVGGALGAAQAVKGAVLAGADLDTERSQARQAGWTEEEIARAEKAAQDYAGRYGIAPGAAMNVIREGRPTFGGSLDQTLANIAPFFDTLTAMRQKMPQASAEENNRQLGSMIKAGEILGYSSDPEKLKAFADFMTQMVQVHGSALRGEEVLNFAKSGKSAASGVSFDYLKSIFPTMLPELGGDRLGTASMTLRQALVGGKMKKRAAENLAELGLIDPAGMIKTADDDVMGVKASAVKGAKLIEQNPLEWVRTVLLPAMDAKGIKPEDRSATLSTLFSDRNAEYLINLLVTQMARLEKDRATVEKAKGLAGAQEALRDDPYLAAKRVAGGAAQVGQALSDPFMAPLKAAADAAASALSGIAATARGEPAAATAGVTGGGLLGGLGGFLASRGGGLWLTGAGTAAGALGGALIGGAGVPIAVGTGRAVGEGLRATGEIAAGKYWTPSSGDAMNEMRGEIAAHRAAIAGIEARTHPSRRGELNPEIDVLQRQIADLQNRIASGSRGWVDAAGAMGERGRGVTQPQLEAVVRPDQIKATLEGQAQVGVAVTVSPSSDFVTRVVQTVLSQVGHIAIGNGPGSTGASMPEAAAPNTGRRNPMGPR